MTNRTTSRRRSPDLRSRAQVEPHPRTEAIHVPDMLTARGQTAADAVGALLVVSVIVAALSTRPRARGSERDLPDRVRDRRGMSARTRRRRRRPRPRGPALSGQDPRPAVPRLRKRHLHRRSAASGPKLHAGQGRVGERDRRNQARAHADDLDPNGCPSQTASVSTSLSSASTGTRRTRTRGSLPAISAQRRTTGSRRAPDEMEAADREAPNPVDPRTLRQGESVELTEEFYAGIGASGSYRNIQVEMGYDRAAGLQRRAAGQRHDRSRAGRRRGLRALGARGRRRRRRLGPRRWAT